MEPSHITFKPIGIIHSCFKEKFGIPRQAGLVDGSTARLVLFPEYGQPEALNEIEQFSHIWVIFVCHECAHTWHPTVRPPRLGGNRRIGVFASRSPFRPNPIGMSAVKLEKVVAEKNTMALYLGGGDFLDATPVLDIKPYISYADSIPSAKCGFAQNAPHKNMTVRFSRAAEKFCHANREEYPHLYQLINTVLQYDPRPAYTARKMDGTCHGISMFDVNITFEVWKDTITVVKIVKEGKS